MDDLYEVEYAKSCNSVCKLCREKIPKDVVRFAILLQSRICDRKERHWHHEDCFLKKKILSEVRNIGNYDLLREEDKKRIKSKIEKYYSTALVLPSTSKIRKRRFVDDSDLNILSTFSIEYAKSNKATCRLCDVKILKNTIKVLKSYYDPKFGDTPMCYHVPCFIQKRFELRFFANGEIIPGFKNLSLQDQSVIRDEIRKVDDGVISKKLKEKCDIEEEVNCENSRKNAKNTQNAHPLKNLQFYLYGKLNTPKESVKNLIYNLGGLVVSTLTETIAAVVTTKEQLTKKSDILQQIKDKKIEVVEESFFQLFVDKTTTVVDAINFIIENNIAGWKSNPFKRIPKDVIDGKNISKAGNMYKELQEPSVPRYVKDGIPIDHRSGLERVAHIYTEDNKEYSKTLSKVNVDQNRNSYYNIELWESDNGNKYWVFRGWGRIGTKIGKTKITCYSSIADAKKEYTKIYTKKTEELWTADDNSLKNSEAYVQVDLSYGDIKQTTFKLDTRSKLPQSVQALIINMFDTEIMKRTLLQFEIDIAKMPLGKLSKAQIQSGYTVLSNLMLEFHNNTADDKKIKEASNNFYSKIPHSVGINRLPLLDSLEIVEEKMEMLNSLLDIEIAYKILHRSTEDSVSPIDSCYLNLKTKITPLDKNDPHYKLLCTYVKNTHAPTHNNYSIIVEEIFRVVREGEENRYEIYKNYSNKRLLWHGSRITNLAGILSEGLRIAPPGVTVTGEMFGKGVYFADMASKSANYCFADRNNCVGFVFACEVALGEMKKCCKAENVTNLPKGKHSVWGVGRTQPDPKKNVILDNDVIVPLGTPIDTRTRCKLLYNEFIIYDIAQVNVKYLLQLKFNFK